MLFSAIDNVYNKLQTDGKETNEEQKNKKITLHIEKEKPIPDYNRVNIFDVITGSDRNGMSLFNMLVLNARRNVQLEYEVSRKITKKYPFSLTPYKEQDKQYDEKEIEYFFGQSVY